MFGRLEELIVCISTMLIDVLSLTCSRNDTFKLLINWIFVSCPFWDVQKIRSVNKFSFITSVSGCYTMMSWQWNASHITGPLGGESTGRITNGFPSTARANTEELSCKPEQVDEQAIEFPVRWHTIPRMRQYLSFCLSLNWRCQYLTSPLKHQPPDISLHFSKSLKPYT